MSGLRILLVCLTVCASGLKMQVKNYLDQEDRSKPDGTLDVGNIHMDSYPPEGDMPRTHVMTLGQDPPTMDGFQAVFHNTEKALQDHPDDKAVTIVDARKAGPPNMEAVPYVAKWTKDHKQALDKSVIGNAILMPENLMGHVVGPIVEVVYGMFGDKNKVFYDEDQAKGWLKDQAKR